MNPELKRKLKALLAKASADLSEAEKTELADLQAKAKAANYDPTKDEGSMSEDDVRALVADGVAKGLTDALKSLKVDETITKGFEDTLKKHVADNTLTSDSVEAALKKHLGAGAQIDQNALVEQIKKTFTENAAKGVTKEALDAALKDFAEKNFRSSSKHQFDDGGHADAFPIEHRNGNLSVAEKQLLNVMLSKVSDEALANSNGGKGIERPKHINDGIPADMLKNAQLRGDAAFKRFKQGLQGKAITTSGAGTGTELVTTELSTQLLMRFYLESAFAREMLASEVQMPSDPFKFPMATTRPTFYVGSEAPGSDPTDSTPGTANVTLDAAKLIGVTKYSYEADEDAVIAVLPMIQQGLAEGAAEAFEGALINGDADGTHQDSDYEAVSGHHAKLLNGLRKAALGVAALKASFATGGISAANIGALRKVMKKYGMRPADLMILVGTNGYNDIVMLDETLTAEKVGNSQARILTGDAPTLFGIRIITSSQMRENLNASGVYDGTTTTKGCLLLVHKPSWLVGVRRGFMVEAEVDKFRQLNSVIASFRRAFSPKETPHADQAIVGIGYNYDA